MTVRKILGDDVCLWPDGTWCYYDEIEEMSHMSDDFEIVPVDSARYHEVVGE